MNCLGYNVVLLLSDLLVSQHFLRLTTGRQHSSAWTKTALEGGEGEQGQADETEE